MSTSEMDIDLAAGEWLLDTASTVIGYEADLVLGLKSAGRFARFEATVAVGAIMAESSVAVTIWTDSVTTGQPTRDKHIRGMLDSAHHPTIEFRSIGVVATPAGLVVTGYLLAHGVSRPVVFEAVRAAPGATGAPRFTAELAVSPRTHGITRRGVSKPVRILLDVVLTPT